MSVAAVVLAAGPGTRFQGTSHKLLAPLRGRPVVAHAVANALGAGLDETVVVVGSADLADVLPDGVTVLENPRWADGQATSLQVAVAHARAVGHEAVVVGLGDQPLVPPEAWRRVAASSAQLAIATFEDGSRTPPVRIGCALWDQLPAAGDEGARVLMRGRPDLVVPVACPGSSVDIDTVEDLSAWN